MLDGDREGLRLLSPVTEPVAEGEGEEEGRLEGVAKGDSRDETENPGLEVAPTMDPEGLEVSVKIPETPAVTDEEEHTLPRGL